MAEIKDKIVTVESLAAVNIHNQETYMTKNDPTGTGTMAMTGDGDFTGIVNVGSLKIGKAVLNYDQTEDALKISFVIE